MLIVCAPSWTRSKRSEILRKLLFQTFFRCEACFAPADEKQFYMTRLTDFFGTAKAIIGMAHFRPLPGDPRSVGRLSTSKPGRIYWITLSRPAKPCGAISKHSRMAAWTAFLDMMVRETKAVNQDVPVLISTGVQESTAAEQLAAADGAIVGSSLKKNGNPWNHLDAEPAKSFMWVVRSARA